MDEVNKNKLKVLVTGAKGQLGKKINDLLKDKFDLILTDSDEMDITDKSQIDQVIKSSRPDWIIHGAAYTKVDQAEEQEELCRKVNAEGTRNLAEAVSEADIPVIYISTDFVFGGDKKEGYIESDQVNPLSVYGQTKFEGEEFIRNICKKHYILRIAWLFGELPENHPGTNFVETMLRLGRERGALSVVNDQVGSPTYTKDLVEVMDKIISKNESEKVPCGTYHFSGKDECSWYDFAKEIFELAKLEVDLTAITSDQYPQKAKRPTYSYLNKDKIEKALEIQVRSWKEMLLEYINQREN